MYHRPPDALKFGVIDRSDVGQGVKEVIWPNGDRSYGRGRFYVVKAWLRRAKRRKTLFG